MSKPQQSALLAKRLQRARQRLTASDTIPPRPDPKMLPLSFTQERFWLLNQFDPGSPAYNRPILLRLRGTLVLEAVEHSLNKIIHRHNTLRAIFPGIDGRPRQSIQPPFNVPLAVTDLSRQPPETHGKAVRRWIDNKLAQPFDMAKGPLLRVAVLRLAPDHHLLLLVAQHILFDAWSARLFISELVREYDAFVGNTPSSLPPLPIQYADFACWQRDRFEQGHMQNDLAYWQTQLADAPPYLELPLDHSRPEALSQAGALHVHTLPSDLVARLKQLSQSANATLFMTLLAAFKVLLYRYSGQTDIIVGSPVAGRTHTELEALIGVLFNTLPLRTDLAGNPTFQTLLGRVRQTALDAYAHQALPFEKLIEALNPPRNLNRTPIFQVMFNFENLADAIPPSHYLTVEDVEFDQHVAHYEIAVELTDTAEGLKGLFNYQTDLFEAATIERMAGHFETLLAGIVANPNTPISQLPLLTETERHQLLVEWNDTQADYPKDQCIHQLFESQAAQTPNVTALVFENIRLSYQDLNRQANQLAHYLQSLGVGPETLVGLCVERSLEMVVGLLGILKAGGAYVPLDPAYPQERLAFILADTNAPVLLTQIHLQDKFPDYGGQLICLDDTPDNVRKQTDTNPASNATPTNLAYIIYTSGSTGQPKGVMIEHRALVNFTEMISVAYNITPADRMLQFASISFDASAEEIYPTLTRGATLVLRTDEMLASAPAFFQRCEAWGITVLDLPTAYWHQLVSDLPQLNQSWPRLLRLVVIGGEKALVEAINCWLEYAPSTVRLINGYGPTEATVVATVHEIASQNPGGLQCVPIGRPIGNVQAYILDEQMQPVPVGLPGELHLGGVAVARGYLNRPQLTKKRFIPNPFGAGRLYNTGDLARWLPGGTIEFLGRADNQVKLRGFRIELGEIETLLSRHPAVERCVVIAREDTPGDKRLVAYIIPASHSPPAVNEVQTYLKSKLPDYMIPSAMITVEEFPLTPNGKLDRAALPPLALSRPDLSNTLVAPDGPVEEMLAEIWQDVLQLDQIGRHDNFFQLGGHSLLAVQLLSRIEQYTGHKVSLTTLFQAPTIEQLSHYINQSSTKASLQSLVPLRPNSSQHPIFCLPGNLGNVFTDLGHLVKYLQTDQPVYGLQDNADNPAKIEALAEHYLQEIKVVQPKGPYFFVGICSGGVVAYEMAQQLAAEGERVALLALIEPSVPNVPGLRTYIRFAGTTALQFINRFKHHSQTFIKLKSNGQKDFSRLKRKLLANNWAIHRYAIQPYAGHFHLFLTTDSLQQQGNNRIKWAKYASGGSALHDIPGDHKTITGTGEVIIEEAHMKILAEKLTALINATLKTTK